jgi:hypothetical protein
MYFFSLMGHSLTFHLHKNICYKNVGLKKLFYNSIKTIFLFRNAAHYQCVALYFFILTSKINLYE